MDLFLFLATVLMVKTSSVFLMSLLRRLAFLSSVSSTLHTHKLLYLITEISTLVWWLRTFYCSLRHLRRLSLDD